MARRPKELTDADFRTVDFGGFSDGNRNPAEEASGGLQNLLGRRIAEVYEKERRDSRIAASATKAPIYLARDIVERHIGELRRRGIITLPPNTATLVLALEQLTHDVASAIMDARLARRHD